MVSRTRLTTSAPTQIFADHTYRHTCIQHKHKQKQKQLYKANNILAQTDIWGSYVLDTHLYAHTHIQYSITHVWHVTQAVFVFAIVIPQSLCGVAHIVFADMALSHIWRYQVGHGDGCSR